MDHYTHLALIIISEICWGFTNLIIRMFDRKNSVLNWNFQVDLRKYQLYKFVRDCVSLSLTNSQKRHPDYRVVKKYTNQYSLSSTSHYIKQLVFQTTFSGEYWIAMKICYLVETETRILLTLLAPFNQLLLKQKQMQKQKQIEQKRHQLCINLNGSTSTQGSCRMCRF